mmetsp:Transcript_5032/g.16624  ORF Transcript_5032/g.16624 Transcript_5032/m.16624 type:complete len:159 (+) Transcript_5032:600-1076(+)
MPRKSGQVEASRAYARKLHKKMMAADGVTLQAGAARLPPAPPVQIDPPTRQKLAAIAGTLAPPPCSSVFLDTASYAVLAALARSGSSCATADSAVDSACADSATSSTYASSVSLSSSDDNKHKQHQDDLLSAIEGLIDGDIEYDMMDAHLDELMQYVE